ncbi:MULTISPECIES: RidA family protein [Limibacillus]|jgi:enamine deaminase RidA (YjgF/YER057c/UK114 family)|uniref:Enamine deaminase RidA (YjgF/YER057c/UK114 family) n=1 Tax=Limibacillus halophilus TaxID=1579333 RepID=A0A839SRY9_9PROT|nr:RidA family protein [Limibacillus halophilus]MBB3065078.1 enamine deaminase RidA (YjgF/YER057c/UK114 family) [Limibacillus halophilus]
MAGKIEARLKELGLELPKAAAPAANYVPYVVSGNLVFIAGQITLWNGELKFLGKVGQDFTVDEGKEAAKLCALNIIAQLREAAGGDLDRVKRIVRLGAFVNSTPDFTQQPEVINGASDLIVAVFGESGKHARAAVSAGALPRNVAVEIEAVAELS